MDTGGVFSYGGSILGLIYNLPCRSRCRVRPPKYVVEDCILYHNLQVLL